MPSHYLNQCWNIGNWTLRNKLHWIFNRNSNIFIQENAFENVVCEMAFILSRPLCVKKTKLFGLLVHSCWASHSYLLSNRYRVGIGHVTWWLWMGPLPPCHGPLTRYVMLRVVHARECRERFSRHRLQRKLLVSDPGMYHDTCAMHVPWCMSGSLTRGGGENFRGFAGVCATRNITYLVRGPRQG